MCTSVHNCSYSDTVIYKAPQKKEPRLEGKYTRGRASGLPEQQREPRSSDIPACVPSPGPFSRGWGSADNHADKMSYRHSNVALGGHRRCLSSYFCSPSWSPASVLHDIWAQESPFWGSSGLRSRLNQIKWKWKRALGTADSSWWEGGSCLGMHVRIKDFKIKKKKKKKDLMKTCQQIGHRCLWAFLTSFFCDGLLWGFKSRKMRWNVIRRRGWARSLERQQP